MDYRTLSLNGSFVSMPPPPIWEVIFFEGYTYRPAGDVRVPNAFWRLMQFLVFGFRWRRLPKD